MTTGRARGGAFVLLVGVLLAGCAETVAPEHAQFEEARRLLDRRDVEVRAYQWQLATLAHQLEEGRARSDAIQRELMVQVRDLTATNAALGERLKRAESDRAALAALPEGTKGPRDNVEALRRVLAASEAQNARVAEELGRLSKLLAARNGGEAGTAPSAGRPTIDVVDPWGFGSRK
jgi:chromosome segregation ATPase